MSALNIVEIKTVPSIQGEAATLNILGESALLIMAVCAVFNAS